MLSQSIGQVHEAITAGLEADAHYITPENATNLLKWLEIWQHNARNMESVIESTTGKPVSVALSQARSERLWNKPRPKSFKLHLAVDNTTPRKSANV